MLFLTRIQSIQLVFQVTDIAFGIERICIGCYFKWNAPLLFNFPAADSQQCCQTHSHSLANFLYIFFELFVHSEVDVYALCHSLQSSRLSRLTSSLNSLYKVRGSVLQPLTEPIVPN